MQTEANLRVGTILADLIRRECRADRKKWPHDLVNELVREAWCEGTAAPDLRPHWSPLRPEEGQDDVTAYVMCRHYHGGTIALAASQDFGPRYVNWRPNGEGVSYHDHVHPYDRAGIGKATRTWTADDFLAYAAFEGLELPERAAEFEDRLRAAILRRLATT